MSLEFFMMVRLQVSANVYWQFLGNTFKNTTCTCLHRVKYNLFQLISCWGNFREAALQRCSWPYSGWAFPGLLTDGGWTKKASLPKICHTYPTMMKLGTVIPYLKKIQKYKNHVTHTLSSADISIFSPEISKFCYIKKYRYILYFST